MAKLTRMQEMQEKNIVVWLSFFSNDIILFLITDEQALQSRYIYDFTVTLLAAFRVPGHCLKIH